MKLKTIGMFVLVAVVAAIVSPAFADEADDLKTRFKKRYPILLKLRDSGKVGETWEARAEAVKAEYLTEKVEGEKTLATFLAEENQDRERLFVLMAEDAETTPAKIRERFRIRNFGKAEPDHWLKEKDKPWVQKKDMKDE